MDIIKQFNTKPERSICKALIHLLKNVQFQNITVSQLLTHAEVSRGTFYIYFDDKYHLAEEVEQKAFNGFIQIMEGIRYEGESVYYANIADGCNPRFYEYFDYLEENYEVFKALFSENYLAGFSRRFSRVIMKERIKTTNYWYHTNIAWNNIKPISKKYREEVLGALYINLFSTWIDNGMDFSKDEIVRLLTGLWASVKKL